MKIKGGKDKDHSFILQPFLISNVDFTLDIKSIFEEHLSQLITRDGWANLDTGKFPSALILHATPRFLSFSFFKTIQK